MIVATRAQIELLSIVDERKNISAEGDTNRRDLVELPFGAIGAMPAAISEAVCAGVFLLQK